MKVTPPTIATWMLKRLVLGNRNEALEGDLLEEFQRRCSTNWYWRQVLGAILGFPNLLRIGWITACTLAFAGGWVFLLCTSVLRIAHSPMEMPSGNWIPYGGQISILAVGIVFYIAVPLSVYLAFTRNLNMRAFAVGLGAGMLVIVSFPFFRSHVATPLNYFLAYGRAQHCNVALWLFGYDLWQGSAPLLVAMWAAALSRMKMSPLEPEEAMPPASE